VIEIVNDPPRKPGDIILSGTGITYIRYQVMSRKLHRSVTTTTSDEARERLQTVGQTLGATLAGGLLSDCSLLEVTQITDRLALQYGETLGATEREKGYGHHFGVGLFSGAMDIRTSLGIEGVVAL
jgi:hypothetical protein